MIDWLARMVLGCPRTIPPEELEERVSSVEARVDVLEERVDRIEETASKKAVREQR